MNQELVEKIKRKHTKSPLRSYLWRVELPLIPGFTIEQVMEVSTRVVATTVPFVTLETDKEIHGNSFWYHAKSSDIGNITLEVMEYDDALTFTYFNTWLKMVSNSNGTFNPPVYYKKDFKFYRMNTIKNDVVKDTYLGYFVAGVAELSNDYESNGVVRYTITLTGDSVKHEVLNSTLGITPDQFLKSINIANQLKRSLKDYLL